MRCWLIVALSVVLISGCGSEEPYRKVTVPVQGKVTVDGAAPGSAIQIQCIPDAGVDAVHPSASSTETDADGVFKFSTYETGDGVPPGEYTLIFAWQEMNLLSRQYGGPDKLKGRYSDEKKSTIKLSVKEGTEMDLGVIALTTK